MGRKKVGREQETTTDLRERLHEMQKMVLHLAAEAVKGSTRASQIALGSNYRIPNF